MVDKELEQTSKVEGLVPTTAEVDLSKYVPIEQFRQFQSKKDREVAASDQRAKDLEERLQREREEFLRLTDSQPELKANYELTQLRAKAAQYDKQREVEERLNQSKRQYAELFSVTVEELASTSTPAEAFALARKLEKERLVLELKTQLGLKEGDEQEEAPDVPISQGSPPNATLKSDAEWQRQREEAATAAKDPKSTRRTREQARLTYLKSSVEGTGKRSRPKV